MKNNILVILLLVSLAGNEINAGGGGKAFGLGVAGGVVGAGLVNTSRPREVYYVNDDYYDDGYASQDEVDAAYVQGRRDARRGRTRRSTVRYRN